MITLNLSPKEDQISYKQERIFLVIKNSFLLFLIFLIFITIVLICAKVYLEKNLDDLVGSSYISANLTKEIKIKVNNINTKLRQINEIQKDYYEFSKPLIALGQLIPNNIQITSLNLDKSTMQFSLKGISKTREDLLKLQNNLETSSLFKDLKFPLSNLLAKQNINFEFSGALNTANNKSGSQ